MQVAYYKWVTKSLSDLLTLPHPAPQSQKLMALPGFILTFYINLRLSNKGGV